MTRVGSPWNQRSCSHALRASSSMVASVSGPRSLRPMPRQSIIRTAAPASCRAAATCIMPPMLRPVPCRSSATGAPSSFGSHQPWTSDWPASTWSQTSAARSPSVPGVWADAVSWKSMNRWGKRATSSAPVA
jgi:hypothetical protein